MHIRALDCQGTGGAHSRAGTAIRAFFIVALNFLGGIFDLAALGPEILDTVTDFSFGTRKLKRHHAFFARQNGCIENIENQVEIFGQMINNRFTYFGFRKAKNEYFGIQAGPPE